MKKRYIFDLDGTLLLSDYKLEKEYFENVYGEKANIFNSSISEYLDEYERTYSNYDIEMLSRYLTLKSGVEVNSDVINGWIDVVGCEKPILVPGVIQVLEYLKGRGYSLAVLTNWFGKTQKNRLKRAGLIDYFDDIYTGEAVLKPRKAAYMSAKDRFMPSECVFIGDNLDKDYIGPRACGMDSIIYDSDNNHHKTLVKIRNMEELIENDINNKY